MQEVLISYSKSEKENSGSFEKVRWRKTQSSPHPWNHDSVVGKMLKRKLSMKIWHNEFVKKGLVYSLFSHFIGHMAILSVLWWFCSSTSVLKLLELWITNWLLELEHLEEGPHTGKMLLICVLSKATQNTFRNLCRNWVKDIAKRKEVVNTYSW